MLLSCQVMQPVLAIGATFPRHRVDKSHR